MFAKNPLQIAQLMSGNWAAILPEPIRSVLQLGQGNLNPTGFLSGIQNRLTGNGGLFGGMGNLFGQSAQSGNQGLGGLLQTFSGATQSNPSFASALGLPQLPNLSQFTGGLNGANTGTTGGGIFDSIRNGLGV